MKEKKYFALVTGASSGIGLAFSTEFARRGFSLFMVSNEDENLRNRAGELEKTYGIKAATLCMDLAQADSAQNLFDYCKANNYKIDILVNNAGIFYFKGVIDTQPEKIETIMNLHIHTPVMLTRLFAIQMIAENRKGYILNMASISSKMMMPGISMYASSKSFIHCFSRAMRHEVYDKGLTISTVSPGAVATDLYNLPSRYQKLGMRLGIIISPQKLAKRAVKKMFKRKAHYVPAPVINGFFVFIVNVLPERLIRWILKRIYSRKDAKTPRL